MSRATADGVCCTTAMAMSSNWAVDCGLLAKPMPAKDMAKVDVLRAAE